MMKRDEVQSDLTARPTVLGVGRDLLLGLVASAVLLVVLLVASGVMAQSDRQNARDTFRAAEELLDEERYGEAADFFRQVYENYSESRYAAKSLYWQAFALSREGSLRDLKQAIEALQLQMDRYPEKARRGDSGELAVYIREKLAERGDARSAREIAALADALEDNEDTDSADWRYSDEAKMQALHSLVQMKPERAMPILRRILVDDADRQPEELREQALSLLPQLDSDEAVEILMHVVRNEESEELRQAAVFWLSQSDDEGTVDVLRELLADKSQSDEFRAQAVFALSQVGGPEVVDIMRTLALDEGASEEVRGQAIFWMSQTEGASDLDFMRDLYRSLDDEELKGQVIFAVSQTGGKGAGEWMLEVARDEDADTETRTQALFWAAQTGSVDAATYVKIFDEVDDEELRGQVVFGLSQMGTDEAVDALVHIAEEADDPELREQAIFWLGQTDDDRAIDFLLKIIEEEN
jgi:HEAT repeat protein